MKNFKSPCHLWRAGITYRHLNMSWINKVGRRLKESIDQRAVTEARMGNLLENDRHSALVTIDLALNSTGKSRCSRGLIWDKLKRTNIKQISLSCTCYFPIHFSLAILAVSFLQYHSPRQQFSLPQPLKLRGLWKLQINIYYTQTHICFDMRGLLTEENLWFFRRRLKRNKTQPRTYNTVFKLGKPME